MKPEIKERVEKIRNGEVPEGYKATKVGIIPDDWNNKKLLQIADYVDYRGKTPQKTNNGIFLVTAKNIKKGFIDYNRSKEFVSENEYMDIMSRGLPKLGDVLITTEAPVGNVAQIDKENIALAQRVIKYRGKKNEIDNTYMKFYFLSFKFQKEILIDSTGGTVQGIKGSRLHKLKVSFPKIKEQEKIAEILSMWDKAIELKEKLIDEKNKLRIAIVTDLLFGLKRFDEFIKSHKYNSTKYINIPEDWKFIKISEIATEVSEKNGNHDELPVLSCTKHSGLVDSLTYFKKKVFSEDTSTYKQVQKNQFVYATNHIDEGSIGCQNLYENSLVSPMYTVFKTNSKVNNDFLFSLLKTRLYIFIYQVNMSASVDRRGSLRWNEFSKIRIPLPDIAEQNKIVEFIRSVDNEIELLNKELNQFKEQKRGLMQLLLTGIVRVEVD